MRTPKTFIPEETWGPRHQDRSSPVHRRRERDGQRVGRLPRKWTEPGLSPGVSDSKNNTPNPFAVLLLTCGSLGQTL